MRCHEPLWSLPSGGETLKHDIVRPLGGGEGAPAPAAPSHAAPAAMPATFPCHAESVKVGQARERVEVIKSQVALL